MVKHLLCLISLTVLVSGFILFCSYLLNRILVYCITAANQMLRQTNFSKFQWILQLLSLVLTENIFFAECASQRVEKDQRLKFFHEGWQNLLTILHKVVCFLIGFSYSIFLLTWKDRILPTEGMSGLNVIPFPTYFLYNLFFHSCPLTPLMFLDLL